MGQKVLGNETQRCLGDEWVKEAGITGRAEEAGTMMRGIKEAKLIKALKIIVPDAAE